MCTGAHPYVSDMVKMLLVVICWNAIIGGYMCLYSSLYGWINTMYVCIYKNWKLIYAVFIFFPLFDQLCFYILGKVVPIIKPQLLSSAYKSLCRLPFTEVNGIAGVPKYLILQTLLILFCMFWIVFLYILKYILQIESSWKQRLAS